MKESTISSIVKKNFPTDPSLTQKYAMNHDENLTMRVDLEQILEDVKIGPEPVIAMEIVINHIVNVVNSTMDMETCCNENGCDDGGKD